MGLLWPFTLSNIIYITKLRIIQKLPSIIISTSSKSDDLIVVSYNVLSILLTKYYILSVGGVICEKEKIYCDLFDRNDGWIVHGRIWSKIQHFPKRLQFSNIFKNLVKMLSKIFSLPSCNLQFQLISITLE